MNTLTEIRNIRTDTSTMPRAKLHDRIAMRAGLAMIRAWAEIADYRREDGFNLLELVLLG